jgi:cytochrome P450
MGLLDGLAIAFLQRRPELLRLLAGCFLRTRPLPGVGKTVFVLRDDDVREVLRRDDDFEIGVPNAPKMLCGEFLLGMDPGPQYQREKQVLADALRAASPHFATLVDGVCRRAADEAWKKLPPGRHVPLEIVGAYAEKVTTCVSSEFYGVPFRGTKSAVLRGKAFDVFRLHLRKLGAVIGTRHPAPFGQHAIATRCAKELKEHVDRVVRERKETLDANPAAAELSVLDQLLVRRSVCVARLSDADIARNLIGLMLAGSAAITLSFVRVLDQLLRRPEVLEQAVAAARHGDLATLRELANEAMRFCPTFPALPRYCPRATRLAVGTPRERELPAGTTLLVITASAMFDPLALEQPEVFRPARKVEHLHFGSGTHWCLGADLAMIELVRMLRCFLERPWTIGRRRGPLGNKRIHYDGIAVDRYVIDVDVAGPRARP